MRHDETWSDSSLVTANPNPNPNLYRHVYMINQKEAGSQNFEYNKSLK